jgi:flagellar protein FliL
MAETKKAKKEDEKTPAAAPPELKAVAGGADEGEAAAPAPAEGPARRFSRKKLLLFALLPLLILGGAGAGAYFMGYFGHTPEKIDCTAVTEGDKDYAACAQEMARTGASLPPGVFADIPDMIVNLNATAKQPRFLKISLKVELENKEDQKVFEAILPRVVDQFQTYLRELRLEDLRGSSGMYRMKIELLSRVRAAAPEIKVRDVLFQEILVQ